MGGICTDFDRGIDRGRHRSLDSRPGNREYDPLDRHSRTIEYIEGTPETQILGGPLVFLLQKFVKLGIVGVVVIRSGFRN